MRIAYFSKTNLPSAAANSLQSMQVCSAVVDLKHVVTFFVITEQDSNDNADMASVFKFYNIAGNFNIEQIKIPTTKESRFRYLWSVFVGFFLVARVLIRRDFDVVFGRDLVSCWVATLVGVKTIYESHAPVWFSLVERLIFKVFFGINRIKA